MGENNTSKFALGAISLILVIVVGVVIALNLNSDSEDNENTADTTTESTSNSTDNPNTATSDNNDPMMGSEDESNNNSDSDSNMDSNENDADASQAGVYTDYTGPEQLTSNDNVLFFKASWCSTCAALEEDIESNSENIPSDLSIFTVDYDEETDLRKEYGVTVQHTLVQVDENGEQVQKWVGSPSLDDIVSKV